MLENESAEGNFRL